MKKISFHWQLHPEKDEAWYNEQKARMTEDEIARELDINYRLSVSGRVFEAFASRIHVVNVRPKVDPRCRIHRIWDFGGTNVVLYTQPQRSGQKVYFHERVLGYNPDNPNAKKSTTQDQIKVALEDSQRLFPNADFIDICDPAGEVAHHNLGDPDVEALGKHNIYPRYEKIKHMPSQKKKGNGRKLIQMRLQHRMSNGDEGLIIYVSGDRTEGCPILEDAFSFGYVWRKDHNNVVVDGVVDEPCHPYEDVIDCAIYDELETNGAAPASNTHMKPRGGNRRPNKYLGR